MSYASIQEAMLSGSGIERQFCCHVHGETRASASINSVTGLWFCYACGAKGKYNVSEIPVSQWSTQAQKLIDRMNEEVRVYPESYLDVFDSVGAGDYWLSRFSAEICRKHRLGHDGVQNYATIPVRDQSGQIYGVIRRDLTGRDPAKYRYPHGVNMSTFMYNYHQATTDVLVLTEGATDAIAVEEVSPISAVASYRNGLSRAQIDLLVKYSPTVLLVAYDQDAAGHSGAERVRQDLRGKIRVDRLTWDTYKDLASIPVSERSEMLAHIAESYGVSLLDNSGAS